ncbi:hypothetical protein GCM10009827_101010 [Dactylosporangium maewongense]|uniref:Nuclear transport factor 2 family protein n=1 Tax=Dactylosporangium maewongense TaxID=634393 RepID=A0ABP4NNH4_9ACTN
MAVITIYLNTDRPLQPYIDGQQLTAAISTHLSIDIVAHPEAVADWAFALGNQDLDVLEQERDTDDGETSFLVACLYRLFGNRSMSVGDVVHIQHRQRQWWLACDPTGWRHINEPVHRSGPGPATDQVFQLLHAVRQPALSAAPHLTPIPPAIPTSAVDV